MVKRRQNLQQFSVRLSYLQPQGTLTHRRQHQFYRKELRYFLNVPKPFHACGRQDDPRQILCLNFIEPCIDIAAQRNNFQVGHPGFDLSTPTQRSRTDSRAPGHEFHFDVAARHQNIAHVLPGKNGCKHQALRRFAGNILHTVNRQIDAA